MVSQLRSFKYFTLKGTSGGKLLPIFIYIDTEVLLNTLENLFSEIKSHEDQTKFKWYFALAAQMAQKKGNKKNVVSLICRSCLS